MTISWRLAIRLERSHASHGPVRSQSSWRRATTHARSASSTASSPANRSAASSASSDSNAALTGWSGSPRIGATSFATAAIDAPSRLSHRAPIGADANSVFAASRSPIEAANCSAARMLSSSRSIRATQAASSGPRSCSPASRRTRRTTRGAPGWFRPRPRQLRDARLRTGGSSRAFGIASSSRLPRR